MKKFVKIATIALVVVMMLLTLVACNKNNNNNNNNNQNSGELTPDSIVKLKAIEDYGQDKYVSVSPVTYADTSAQVTKLNARIDQKKDDLTDPSKKHSSATKIFAESNATKIIEQMSKAALSEEKMQKTVEDLAGSTDVTAAMINERAEKVSKQGQTFENTPDTWSFFDDWDYYEELKRIVDEDLNDASESVKNNAEDNVKRQDRNIMRKVFALGLDGAEFGRLATYELDYATDVVEGMAGTTISTDNALTSFDNYCKNELDFETLVYLRSFNKYYNNGNDKNKCVRLYGYYYEYNRTSYNSQSDTDFEKQLKYGHMSKFTENEWLDYVRIQRNSYTGAYRYTDDFYETFYQVHFEFQDVTEAQETIVYDFPTYGMTKSFQNVSYTGEMRKATNNNGLKGQLRFTDWLWCYAGNDTAMKEYNAANTIYEEGKEETDRLTNGGTSDKEYEGKFKFEIEQLKAVDYLMTKMTKTELGQTLYFEVYSYSGELVKAAQEYRKDLVLLANDKKEADDFDYAKLTTTINKDSNPADAKAYTDGKVKTILAQMASTYGKQNVSNKANNAAQQPWDDMHLEVQEAMNHSYTGSWQEKSEALEDMVIKRHWSCGAAIDDDNCPNHPGVGHVDCTKEYDTTHKISQFASNYQAIVRYMVGQSEMTFKRLNENTCYDLKVYTPNTSGTGKAITVGYVGLKAAKAELGESKIVFPDDSAYIESKTLTVNSGKAFNSDLSGKDKSWWNGTTESVSGSRPKKDNIKVSEGSDVNPTTKVEYTYSYTFSGWYLDKDLTYAFDPTDKIGCDLTLYAGYNFVKKSA